MSFKVGLDGKILTLKNSGIGRYSLQLCQWLSRLEDAPEIAIYPSLKSEINPPAKGRCPALSENYLFRGIFSISRWAQSEKLDLYHCLNYYSGPLVSISAPWLLNIYDLSPLRRPEFYGSYFAAQARFLLPHHARRADHIITVSQSSRAEIIEFLSVDRDRISVIYPAPDDKFIQAGNSIREKEIRSGYGLDWPYLLFVGVLHPRKNLAGLIRAFAKILEERADEDHRLVLAGPCGWKSEALFSYVREHNLERRVIYLGFVPDEHLPALYRGATALVYPSFYEGFGYPVLEALACGTPAIASNSSSLPEAAGPGALLVDPHFPDQLVNAIKRMISDSCLRQEISRKGREWSRNFNWEKTAAETLSVYKKVLSG